MASENSKPPKKPRQRTSRKAKIEKHRTLMDDGLKAEIKFNSVMAERRMAAQEERAKAMNEAFAARKLAEKMAAEAKKTEMNVESLGEGMLMASGLDFPVQSPTKAAKEDQKVDEDDVGKPRKKKRKTVAVEAPNEEPAQNLEKVDMANEASEKAKKREQRAYRDGEQPHDGVHESHLESKEKKKKKKKKRTEAENYKAKHAEDSTLKGPEEADTEMDITEAPKKKRSRNELHPDPAVEASPATDQVSQKGQRKKRDKHKKHKSHKSETS